MRSCPQCHRANPEHARYCHYDGILLDATPMRLHASGVPDRFPREWTFPSGRRCISRESLVQGCLSEWNAARIAYAAGHLGRFLSEISEGRWMPLALDLDTDDDTALQCLIEQIADPEHYVRPQVELTPRRLDIEIQGGQQPIQTLRIHNRGAGFLHGEMTIREGTSWMRLGPPGSGSLSVPIRTFAEQRVQISIRPQGLPGPGNYLGKLLVHTNGGTLEIPIQATQIASGKLFRGYPVATEKDLARVMRDHPREAARWIEDGSVMEWFRENHLPYPLPDRIAPGIAAVQQLFEAMNVAKPPPIYLEETVGRIVCQYPETVTRSVCMRTRERKWIYGFVSSDEYWLKPVDAVTSGAQEAEISYTIDTSLLESGRTYEGRLRISANSGQELTFLVIADVRSAGRPFTRRLFG